MADFVAVIRRAVDGLSDNNPEMRSKVYEKARGAVRRQLEAMNPRPSDDLIQRQLDKLEAAIGSVEGEHAEALPAEEAVPEPVFEAVEPEPAPVEPEPVAAEAEEPQPIEPEPEPEPVETVAEEPQPEPEPFEEPASYEEPAAYEAPVSHEEPSAYAEPASYEEPAPYEEPVSYEEPAPVEEPVSYEPAPVEVEQAAPEPVVVETYGEPEEPAEEYAEETALPEEAAPVAVEASVEPVWHAEIQPSQPVDDYVPSWQTEEPAAVEPEPEAHAFEQGHDEAPAAAEVSAPESDAHLYWQDPAPAMSADEQPQEAARPVEDFGWEWPEDNKPAEAEAHAEAQAESHRETRPADAHEWGDLDDLLGGHTAPAPAGEADAGAAAASAAVAETAQRGPQRSFRAEPRKSRLNLGAAVALVALLAVVGGAGAAYWFNRDKVDAWVGETLASLTGPAETPATTTESAQTPISDEGAERSLPAATADAQQPEAAGTEVAALSTGQDSSGKFTQRLLADGSEVDEGPAASLDASVAEGKSVSPQSEETAGLATEETPAVTDGAVDGPAVAQDGGADAAASGTTDTQVLAADAGQAAGLGVAQKMFLYEERLGQTAPTAIEGTVVWSQAEESPGGDARPEPVVRAQINVPASGLTALITFRRNADQSLPASHIVEIVFSLPSTFEGGAIESVQRVAMKRTEQDRGDQLIAVPAKITDDFHMIALNDFPEAIAKNTELLRTRGWIDIPVTYRNGRRALITLDKGASGTEAFDTVMKAWAAQGAPNSQ